MKNQLFPMQTQSDSTLRPKATWDQIKCPDINPRSNHSISIIKNYLLIYAGSGYEDFRGIKILDLSQNIWMDYHFKDQIPPARKGHTACLSSPDQIIIFGGLQGSQLLGNLALITLKETKPMTIGYEALIPEGGDFLALCNHTADIYEEEMFVFGGRCQVDLSWRNTNRLWSLNLSNLLKNFFLNILESCSWRLCAVTGDLPEARMGHNSAIYNKKLFIIGGYSDERKTRLDDICILSLETMKWEKVMPKGLKFKARFGACSGEIAGKLYIFGGSTKAKGFTNNLFSYDLENNIMEKVPTRDIVLPPPLRDAKGIVYGDRLAISGGQTNTNAFTSNIYCLTLEKRAKGNIYEGKMESLFGQIEAMLFSEKACDVSFLVQGEKIPAHKFILIARSKYFEHVFLSKNSQYFFHGNNRYLGGMKESIDPIIEISDVKIDAFKALLRFLYTNRVALTESLAFDLYELGDKYLQKDIMEICEEFLVNNINLENLERMEEFAKKFEIEELEKEIIGFIKFHQEEIHN